METRAKKMKIDDSNDQSSDDFCFFDKMPEEIIENIISFVPCKNNCFLVSKKFNRESTNATRRNQLTLQLDQGDMVRLQSKTIFSSSKVFAISVRRIGVEHKAKL